MQKMVVLKMNFGFLMIKEKIVGHIIKHFFYFQEDMKLKFVKNVFKIMKYLIKQ